MRRSILTAGVCLGLLTVASVTMLAIGTIKEVSLDDGRDDVTKIAAPVVDGSATAVTIGTFTGTFDRGAKVVRRGATGFMTRGPEYNLDKSLDLAALFATALRDEAGAMGFKTAASDAWQVGGTIKDLYLESKQIPYGATLFYGYMSVDFTVAKGSGAPETVPMRLHVYNGGYNAGMGRKDEAEAALAHLLIEGAQDALARLNRLHFKAPAHSAVGGLVDQVKKPGDKAWEAAVRRLSLSGASGAAAVFLELIPKDPDENRRSALIEGLGRLGAPEAVGALTQRYAAEDEDCRWYTLKTLDYIGGAAAEAHIKGAGVADKDGGPRRLAEKVAGKK
jgi:hypothetical protein